MLSLHTDKKKVLKRLRYISHYSNIMLSLYYPRRLESGMRNSSITPQCIPHQVLRGLPRQVRCGTRLVAQETCVVVRVKAAIWCTAQRAKNQGKREKSYQRCGCHAVADPEPVILVGRLDCIGRQTRSSEDGDHSPLTSY